MVGPGCAFPQSGWHWSRLPCACRARARAAILSRFFGPSGKREPVVTVPNERERLPRVRRIARSTPQIPGETRVVLLLVVEYGWDVGQERGHDVVAQIEHMEETQGVADLVHGEREEVAIIEPVHVDNDQPVSGPHEGGTTRTESVFPEFVPDRNDVYPTVLISDAAAAAAGGNPAAESVPRSSAGRHPGSRPRSSRPRDDESR